VQCWLKYTDIQNSLAQRDRASPSSPSKTATKIPPTVLSESAILGANAVQFFNAGDYKLGLILLQLVG
jgi:hypothetical protein